MKAILILVASMLVGSAAQAYQYQYNENVRYRSGGTAYTCWTIKVWEVTAQQLNQYGGRIQSQISSACRNATGKRCQDLNSSVSCRTRDNCAKTFRSCTKGSR